MNSIQKKHFLARLCDTRDQLIEEKSDKIDAELAVKAGKIIRQIKMRPYVDVRKEFLSKVAKSLDDVTTPSRYNHRTHFSIGGVSVYDEASKKKADAQLKAAKDLNEKRKMLYNTTLKDKVKVIKDKVILGSIDSDEAIAILNEFEKNK